MLKVMWQNYQIKKGMREGVDFILVTREVFTFLNDRYGAKDKDADKKWKRVGVEQDDGEVVCELRMRKIQFVAIPNATRFKMKEPWFFYAPKSDTVLELEKKAARSLNYYMYSVRRDSTTVVTKCRLWKTSDSKMEDLEKIDNKYRNYTSAKVSATPVSMNDD